MKRFKRFTFIGICVFMTTVMLTMLTRGSIRPAMPDEWHKLQKGMVRKEALSMLRGEVEDLRELKGFDQITHETYVLGSSSFWQLYVNYDDFGHIRSASARFVCRPNGFFNTTSTLID